MDGTQRLASIRLGAAFPDDGGPAIQYHLSDIYNTSQVTLDETGSWCNREEYSPFGESLFGGFAKKRYRFTGKERDEESGFSYHGARYYASWMCRWASADPAGLADGLNRYLYARGSPIRLMDGTGLEGEESQGAGNYQCTVEGMQNPVESNVDAMAQFSKEDWEAVIAADMAPNSPQMFETGSEQHLNHQEKVNQPMQEQFLKDEALRSMYRSSAGGLGGSMGKIAGDGLSAVQNAQDGVVGQTLEQLQVTATLANVGALADAGAVGQFLSPKKKAQTSKTPEAKPVLDVSAFGGRGETFYRSMSRADADNLASTGSLSATAETFISPTRTFAERYEGVLVRFSVLPGTTSRLAEIGVRDGSTVTSAAHPGMAPVGKGWTSTSVFFKGEGGQVNIGLGQGQGLKTFNESIQSYEILRP